MTTTRDKTKQRLQEQLKNIFNQNDEMKMAAALFGITSAEYLKFDYSMVAEKEMFERMNHTMNDYQEVLKDLLKEKFDDNNPEQGLQFSIQLMDNLIRLGDLHSAYAIKAALADVEFRNRKNPAYTTAVNRLSKDKEMAAKLNQIKVDRSMFLLENYEKFANVSVPYFGIYANTADKLKEASRSASQQSAAGKQTQADVLEKTVKFLKDTKAIARKQRDTTEKTQIDNLRSYIDGYALSSNSADKKKFALAKVLFGILHQSDFTPDEKIRALKNFIDQAPKVLEHKSPLNKGREHTLEKMAKELLAFYAQEQGIKKSQQITNLVQSKKLFTEQMAAGASKKKPVPPSRAGRRSLTEPTPVKSSWEKAPAPKRSRSHSQGFLFSKDRQAQKTNTPRKTADELRAEQAASERTQKNPKVSTLVKQFESGIFSHSTDKAKKMAEQKKANPDSPHHRSRKPR